MTAEEIISGAQLSHSQTVLVEDAFQEVWAAVEARFLGERSRNKARVRLASILALLARVVTEADYLKAAALRAFTRVCHASAPV